MKYYYIINGKIMSANEKMPEINEQWHNYNSNLLKWSESLQPCEISESELEKVIKHYLQDCSMSSNPIEVTDIVELEWNKKYAVYELFFKQPKQVGEIEAVDFAAYLSVNNWESSNGIMYNKFRIEYGSKYIVTTEHIKQLYEIFKNQK